MRQRLRALVRREPSAEQRYASFQAEVEPQLRAIPRVHRFAAVPVLGDAETPAQPIAAGALTDTRAPWVALADSPLEPAALERLGQAATLAPDASVITCDDDVLATDGRRSDPRFHPGPSPDGLLTGDAPLAVLCVKREAALAVLADIPDTPARRRELLLRLSGPDGAGHAHVPAVLAHRSARPDTVVDGGATARVLEAWGDQGARVDPSGRITRTVRGEPLVDIVVLFRDKPELLERCVRSVLSGTAWERLRLRLVDNGSSDPQMGELLRRVSGDERVVLTRDDRPFNFAALNNAAIAGSDADFVVFLNNDTEVISPDWVQALLGDAQRPEVGAVAPLLLYPGGEVQHAGAAIGLHGYAGHPFAGLAPEAATPFGKARAGTRNWLAVTAACMMVERAKLAAVGGFDERFVVGGNDVDLCLRLTAAGHRSLCLTDVEMLHDESRSRGTYVDPGDFARSEESYGAFRTIGDPFYNPNLTLTTTTCQPREKL